MASLRKKLALPVSADPVVAITDPASAPDDAGSNALRVQLENLRQSETLQQQQAAERQRQAEVAAEVNQRCQDWVAGSPLAQQNQAALPDLHQGAVGSGLVTGTPDYFAYMESQLERQARQHPTEELHKTARKSDRSQYQAPLAS